MLRTFARQRTRPGPDPGRGPSRWHHHTFVGGSRHRDPGEHTDTDSDRVIGTRSFSRRAGARDLLLSRNAAGDVEPSLASGPPAVPNQLPGDSSRPEQLSLPIGGPQPRICLCQQHLLLSRRRARRRSPRSSIWALRRVTPAGMSQDELIERAAGPRGKGFMTACLHKGTRDAMLSTITRSYSLRGSWRP